MKNRLTYRLKKLIRCFFLVIAITLNLVACEMNNSNDSIFNPVEDDIYQLDTIIKSGCFDPAYSPDTSSSVQLIIEQDVIKRIDDSTFYANIFENYNCNAIDSISLIGNQLDIFLKSEDSNCRCQYEWEFTFTMTENKWLQVRTFVFTDNEYKTFHMITSNLENY